MSRIVKTDKARWPEDWPKVRIIKDGQNERVTIGGVRIPCTSYLLERESPDAAPRVTMTFFACVEIVEADEESSFTPTPERPHP